MKGAKQAVPALANPGRWYKPQSTKSPDVMNVAKPLKLLLLRIRNQWAIRGMLCLRSFRARKPSKEELKIVMSAFNMEFQAGRPPVVKMGGGWCLFFGAS